MHSTMCAHSAAYTADYARQHRLAQNGRKVAQIRTACITYHGPNWLRAPQTLDVVKHEYLILASAATAEQREPCKGRVGKGRRHFADVEGCCHLKRHTARALRTVREHEDHGVARKVVDLVRRRNEYTPCRHIAQRLKHRRLTVPLSLLWRAAQRSQCSCPSARRLPVPELWPAASSRRYRRTAQAMLRLANR